MRTQNLIEILYEQTLEELSRFNSNYESSEEMTMDLHEMEFKLYEFTKSPYSFHPMLLKNLLIKFLYISDECWENLSQKIVSTFSYWMGSHRIENAEAFADMIIDELRDGSSYDDEAKNDAITNGISRGQVMGEWITVTRDDIIENIDKDRVKGIFRDEIQNNPELLQMYSNEEDIKEFLKNKGWDEDRFERFEDEQGDNIEAYINYLYEEGLFTEVLDNALENLDIQEIMGMDPDTYNYLISWFDIKNAIINKLYPQYMDVFGDMIINVIKECRVAMGRIKETKRVIHSRYRPLYKKIQQLNLNGNEENRTNKELEECIQEAYQIVSKMTIAISLALNVIHVHGNIIIDYGDYADLNISSEFLNKLHKLDTEKWKQEIQSIKISKQILGKPLKRIKK